MYYAGHKNKVRGWSRTAQSARRAGSTSNLVFMSNRVQSYNLAIAIWQPCLLEAGRVDGLVIVGDVVAGVIRESPAAAAVDGGGKSEMQKKKAWLRLFGNDMKQNKALKISLPQS